MGVCLLNDGKKNEVFVFTRNLRIGGGISKWIIDYYTQIINSSDVKVTLFLQSGESEYNLEEIPFPVKRLHNIKKHPIKAYKEWREILQYSKKNGNWLHFHTDNLVNFFPYVILESLGKRIIIQSHSSSNDEVLNVWIKRILNYFGKKFISKCNFVRFAVSDKAARWLFGNADYIPIHNGINLDMFQFSLENRKKYRHSLNLEDMHVYGHVGRFELQKNHQKLISIFSNIYKQDPLARLILVGNGKYEEKIKDLVDEMNLHKVVLFLGIRNDVSKMMNAFDYTVFPSLYEGLPLSLIEAQANGIQVFYSNRISNEIRLLSETYPINIESDANTLSKFIMDKETLVSYKDRLNANNILRREGYDRSDTISFLIDFYKGERRI